ncbi:MAG: hypothetical protein KAG66_17045, partial [Methylococcales bacterium]|nr:hypothetical protein [Methylococcales bacterium]
MLLIKRLPQIYLLGFLFLVSTGCSQLFNPQKPLPTFVVPLQDDTVQVAEAAEEKDTATAVSTPIPTVQATSNPTEAPTKLPTNTPKPTAAPTQT